MTIGHKLGLRLFLEGIEVPVIGASVQIAANGPAAAAIQVIATDKVLELYPRTMVHLFFLDFVEASSPLDDAATTDQKNAQYKILFMGEIQGIQFQKGSGERSVVLNCVDFSNYWDTTYQYNFGGSLFGGRKQAAFIGANSNFFTSPLGHGTGSISTLLSGKCVSFPQLEGLLAGIVSMLEAVGGAYHGTKTFSGSSDFSSIAELRVKLLQQVTAAEGDTSTKDLFARKTFNQWMGRQTRSLGKLVTFRGLCNLLQQFIFHECFPNPVAKYRPKDLDVTKPVVYRSDPSKNPQLKAMFDAVKALRKDLRTLEKAFNSWRRQDKKWQEKSKVTGDLSTASTSLQSARQQQSNALVGVATPAAKKVAGLSGKVNSLAGQFSTLYDLLVPNGSSRKIDSKRATTNASAATTTIDKCITLCNQILAIRIAKKGTRTYDVQDRVNNQIFRPDMWFASPPRCNILFPEMYEQFSWSRNFFREVSRMELQTTHELVGDDSLFNGRYFAPDVADMRSGLKLSQRRFNRLIMNHELYTGIIPMYEKISQANLFAMKAGALKTKAAKVPYAQRAVNFNYFKHRFSSRQMSAMGRFNPWFVAGFPAALLDRQMTASQLAIAGLSVDDQVAHLNITLDSDVTATRAMLLQYLVPTQFLGTCASLVHNVNQGGGNTQYQFIQARVHRETTEYLGVDKATVSTRVGNSTATTYRAGTFASKPSIGSVGPRGGKVTAVKEAAKYRGTFMKAFGTGQLTLVELSPTVPASSADTTVRSWEISETIDRYSRRKVDLPIEAVVRPPWIWDGWTNLKIGKTYQEFFGVGALTDVASDTSSAASLKLITDTDAYEANLVRKEALLNGPKRKVPTSNAELDLTELEQDKAAKVSVATMLEIEKERTIENSIDYLVRIYSLITQQNLDMAAFIRNYGWRPVATMVDILGSSNFTLTQNGEDFTTTGTEGFHSRAFSDEDNLFGLVNPKIKKLLGLSKGKDEATAQRMDVRGTRRAAVREYAVELTNSQGLLG
jgi:hypothetical protein